MELMEPIAIVLALLKQPEYLLVKVIEIKFDSGIKLYNVEAGGAEVETPPAGTPHWGGGKTYPAVYVREGGTGEVKTLKVKVEWRQLGRSGSAKLKGRSPKGTIVIEGSFSISGDRGEAEVSCEFTKRPNAVANFGTGVPLTWTVECAGEKVTATGGNSAILYFVDAKPLPIGWGYKKHYLKVVHWTTLWAAGRQGKAKVLAAIWAKFSNGKKARVPHATGFSYWKTGGPVQDLKTLLRPDDVVLKRGWSCKAIAHLFMECLALHGIKVVEVMLDTAPSTQLFLVHNWSVRSKPIPNWDANPQHYYAGSWIESSNPPLASPVPTSLFQHTTLGPTKTKLKIDMLKKTGVPAQGQPRAPLGFSNHWIVEVEGSLYDTSYGLKHPNDMIAYAKTSLAGWLIGSMSDSYTEGKGKAVTTKSSAAWYTVAISTHTLLRTDLASN